MSDPPAGPSGGGRTYLTGGVVAIVVALIGLIGVVIANQGNDTSPTPPPAPSPAPATTPATTAAATTSPPSPRVVISSPRQNQRVPVEIEVRGRSQNLGPNEEIWVFVLPSDSRRYYPENAAAVESSGDWSLPVRLGGDEHRGIPFDIFAVFTTSSEARSFLQDYNRCRDTGECPGLERIPPGASVGDRIRVIRR